MIHIMPYKDPAQKLEYQRKWVAARRAQYFSDKRCARCDSIEDLRLDHVNPTQKVSHKIWSWSAERREVEIAKCQILCEPCHKEKNLVDLAAHLGKPLYQHGTHGMYVHHKCRCRPCKDAHAETNKKYR